MYKGHTVAVVIPTYNEEGFVGGVIDTLPPYVDRAYVVDDCSTDRSWEEITRRAASVNERTEEQRRSLRSDRGTMMVGHDSASESVTESPKVVPIRHEENRGVGGAIKTGYERSLEDGMDVTAVMAGDGQMDPDQLERLLDPIVEGRAAYAKGNRLADRRYYEDMTRWRLFGNRVLTILTRVASGYWGMMDPQNGYTAISKRALEEIDLDELFEEYGFANDLLISLNTYGFTIADVAMPAVYGDEQSHIRYRTFVPRLARLLTSRFVRRIRTRYVLVDSHPLALLYALGVVGVFGGLSSAIYSTRRRDRSRSERDLLPTSIAILFVSITNVLLGATLDRFENRDTVVSIR